MPPKTTAVDYNPFGDIGGALPEAYGAGMPIMDPIANMVQSAMTLPKRTIDASSQYHPGTGQIPDELIGTGLESAMLPMGTGAIAGVPVRAGESVLGSGLITKYKEALKKGDITQQEYEGFMDALRFKPSGFPDRASARAELNLTRRLIDKYWAKDRAHNYENGPKLSAEERAEWQNAFKRRQAAQQYLESSQPVDLTPVDHDPFGEQ